jgi:hypothetical protein
MFLDLVHSLSKFGQISPLIFKGNVLIQPLIFFIPTTTFSKKLCDYNWNEKSDYDFQAYFFVLMAPAFGSIAIWGSPQRWEWRLCRSPQERDNYRLEYDFQKIL